MTKFSKLVRSFAPVAAVIISGVALGGVSKTRVIHMNPSIDVEKPLAALDYPGWTSLDGRLIGSYSPHWIGARNAQSSTWEWWYKIDSPLSSPISSLGNGTIAFGTVDGAIHKLDASTGKGLWKTNIDSFTSKELVVSGSHVIVVTSRQQVYSLDIGSGSTRWLYDAGAPDSISIRSGVSPYVQSNTVYIGTSEGSVHAIDLEMGKQLWKTSIAEVEGRFHDVVGEFAQIESGLLFTRYDGLIGMIDLSEGDHKVLWKEEIGLVATSTTRSGRLFVGCLNGEVLAFDGMTGKKVWRADTGQAVGHIAAFDEDILVAGLRGRLNRIGYAEGKVIWYDDFGGNISAKPVFLGSEIFYPTGMKVLYGYNFK
jgi:outer membrane protein assembly factor BamB